MHTGKTNLNYMLMVLQREDILRVARGGSSETSFPAPSEKCQELFEKEDSRAKSAVTSLWRSVIRPHLENSMKLWFPASEGI